MKKRRIVAFLMATVLMASGFVALDVSAATIASGERTSLSLENAELRVRFEENGKFAVTDKINGTTFASSLSTEEDNFSAVAYRRTVASEIVIHYYISEEERVSSRTDVAYSISATAETVRDGDGIRVKYDFAECEIRVDVVYALKDHYLSASVDFSTVDEYGKYSVCKIDLLPGIGAGKNEDGGYMLVPDGSGALIHFNNGETQQYQADVYGEECTQEKALEKTQMETIRMPVFGIVRKNTAVFGIVDSGDAISSITAFSGNAENNYNTAYSGANITFNSSKKMFADSAKNNSTAYYRTEQTAEIDKYTVLYSFLSGDNADYSGMARVYRDYLIKEQGLKQHVSEPVLNVDLVGAIDVKKNFLGLTYYKPLALTTYDQAAEIAKSLVDSGVDKVSLRYIGWNNDGISNEKVLKKLKLMRALGGSGDFEQLNESLDDMDINITYDVDFTKFYKGSKKYKVMNPFAEEQGFFRYLRSVYATDLNARSWYQLTPSHWSEISEKLLLSAKKLELTNLSLASLTSSIYSDFRFADPFTRGETKNAALQIMQNFDENMTLSGDTVNAYAFSYVNKIYATPSYTSGFFVLDEEVPFYQMVLHGYVDLTAPAQFTAENNAINYLKAVETGSQLLYTGIYSGTDKVTDTDYDYLYGTQYTIWAMDAAEKYAEYQPLLEKIYDSEIVSHTKLVENVFQTTYANGIAVVVNYNDMPVNVNGMEITEYGFCEVMQ